MSYFYKLKSKYENNNTTQECKSFELNEPVQDIKDTIDSLLNDFLGLFKEYME